MSYTVGWATTKGDQILVRTVSHSRIAAMLNFLVLEVDHNYQRFNGHDREVELAYARETVSRRSRVFKVIVEEMKIDE